MGDRGAKGRGVVWSRGRSRGPPLGRGQARGTRVRACVWERPVGLGVRSGIRGGGAVTLGSPSSWDLALTAGTLARRWQRGQRHWQLLLRQSDFFRLPSDRGAHGSSPKTSASLSAL